MSSSKNLEQLKTLTEIIFTYISDQNLQHAIRIVSTNKVLSDIIKSNKSITNKINSIFRFAYKNEEIIGTITSDCNNITYKQTKLIDIIKNIKINGYAFILEYNRNFTINYNSKNDVFSFKAFHLTDIRYTQDPFYITCLCNATYKNNKLNITIVGTEPVLEEGETIATIINNFDEGYDSKIDDLCHNNDYKETSYASYWPDEDVRKIALSIIKFNSNENNDAIITVVDNTELQEWEKPDYIHREPIYRNDSPNSHDSHDGYIDDDYSNSDDIKKGGTINKLQENLIQLLKLVPSNKQQKIISDFYCKYPAFEFK